MKATDFNLKKYFIKEAIVVPATESCSCGCDCGKAICESCGKKNHTHEGWARLPDMPAKYVARDGLEGPIMTRSGKVVYYDNVEGKYYDPDTDMYLTYDEWKAFDPELPIKSEATEKDLIDMYKGDGEPGLADAMGMSEEEFAKAYVKAGEDIYKMIKAHVKENDFDAEGLQGKALMKLYKDNEHNNHHSENNLLLAKAFGTPKQVKMVELIIAKNQKQGYTDTMDSEWMYHNINKPYYKQLVAGSLGEEFQEANAWNKYGLTASKVGGKYRSYQHGKLTGEFDTMDELQQHQMGLIGEGVNEKQRLDPSCWKGYKKDGTKMKGGVRVNNCVPENIREVIAKLKGEIKEWVQDSPAQGFSGQERNFIQELCLRMDGVSKSPEGLKWMGKSKTWDEGNVLSDKGKLTTVMLWAKKNIDDLYHKMGSEFKVYSDGNDEGDSGRGQSDGNQIIQNIINKVGKIGRVKEHSTSSGNMEGYLNTIDEYVEMLFKSAQGTDNKKATEIAYRIQNAVDDIRTRELGLKPSLVRAKYNKQIETRSQDEAQPRESIFDETWSK